MERFLDFLVKIGFVVAFLLLVIFISFTMPTQGSTDTNKAMRALRETAVMVAGGQCSGSGSIVQGKSGKRYLLTNNHVCNCGGEEGYVYGSFEGGELVKGKIAKRSWAYDLCAARVEDSRPALKLGSQLLPFTEVNTRGYPMRRLVESHGLVGGEVQWGYQVPIEEVGECPQGSEREYALNGNLAACILPFTSTVTSLYGRPGSSGSPVVNDDGDLVGVLSSYMPGSDYSAGIVRFQDVKRFLEAL